MTNETLSYKNPPIVEAICEFRFDTPWDVAWVGAFKERVKEQFPKRRLNRTFQAIGGSHVQQASTSHELHQFFDVDERQVISLGPNVLSIHVLRPYPGWAKFRELIDTALTAYLAILDSPPAAVAGGVIRYINMITVPGQTVELEKYFVRMPSPPRELGASGLVMNEVFVRWAADEETKSTRSSLTIASQPSDDDSTCLFLVDVAVARYGSFQVGEALEVMDEVHRQEKLIFADALTGKTKELFNG